MGRIIIDNRSSQSDLAAIDAVKLAMGPGRISNKDRQYCYLTIVPVPGSKAEVAVTTDLNKRSDRFVVSDHKW